MKGFLQRVCAGGPTQSSIKFQSSLDGIDSVTSESKSVLAWLLSVREDFDLRLSS